MSRQEEILEIAKGYGIELEQDTLEMNESGIDFQVALGREADGKEWVLRLPRRTDVFERTHSEKQVLDFVDRRVDFEVPVWEVHAEDLIAYRKLTGIPAATIDMGIQNYRFEFDEKNVPERFVDTLGHVMASLHSVSAEQAGEAGIKVQAADTLRETMKKRMEKAREAFGASDELWDRWQRWLDDEEMWPKETGLIHGDLHPGHIMIDDDEGATGLIDWTEGQVADISKDFVGHLMVFGEESLDDLLEAYRRHGGRYWSRMKQHILELRATYPVDIAEFAIISGQREYEDMAKQALGVE